MTVETPTPSASTPDTTPVKRGRGSSRWQSIAVGVLVVLTSIAVLASALAVWGTRTVFNTDKFVSTTSQVLSQPEVTDALASYLTNQLLVVVDAEGRITEALPESLGPLAPAIEGGVRSYVHEVVTRLLEQEQVREVLQRALRTAHASLMDLLGGDVLSGDGLTIEDGTVTLNLLPVIDRALHLLQDQGVIDPDRDIPELAEGTNPSEQVRALADRFGRDLPEDFGQFTLYSSDSLEAGGAMLTQARDAVVLLKRAVVALLVVTLLLALVVLAISENRWRTLAQLGIGVGVAMVLARVATNRLVENLPSRIAEAGDPSSTGGSSTDATRAVLQTVTGEVRALTGVFLVVALTVALIGLVFGRSSIAVATRQRVGSLRSGDGAGAKALSGYVDLARGIAGLASVLIVFFGGLRWWSIIVAALLFLFVVGATARLGRGDHEVGEASMAETPSH